jgi:hypothetical protein
MGLIELTVNKFRLKQSSKVELKMPDRTCLVNSELFTILVQKMNLSSQTLIPELRDTK